MIVIDTNVISELTRSVPDSRVVLWHELAVSDAQIAAICRRRNLQLATRNVRDFEACGIQVVDPFA